PYRGDTSELSIARSRAHAFEFAVILRHGKEVIGECRRLELLELAQTLVLLSSHHHNGWLSVLGYCLGRAPRRLNDGAEAILRVLHRPASARHGIVLSSQIFWLDMGPVILESRNKKSGRPKWPPAPHFWPPQSSRSEIRFAADGDLVDIEIDAAGD